MGVDDDANSVRIWQLLAFRTSYIPPSGFSVLVWIPYHTCTVLYCTCFLEDDRKAIPVDSKRFLHSVRVCMYSRFVFKSEHLLQYARSSNPMSRFPVTLCRVSRNVNF